jgi:hypothetical protein
VIRLRPLVVGIVAWGAGAATAAAVGLLALPLVGVELGLDTGHSVTDDPLARAEPAPTVSPPPSSAPVSTNPAAPTTSQGAAPHPDQRTVTSAGGTVVARCSAGSAYIVYWTPAQGYHSDGVVRGPAPMASVKFEGQGPEITITITCVNGEVRSVVRSDH